ncbi:MAG: hypothetical protein IPI67_24450 [Myxococcales bacterium]|nr:hypothetical protein [Myxococcales bacterium]
MFTGGVFAISGNIPDSDWQRIQKVAAAIYSMLNSLAQQGRFDRRVIRLLKPVNTAVLLTEQHVHIVCTNKGVGGALRVVHNDLRGRGPLDLSTAIAIVERDLVFEQAFGFSFPALWVAGEEPGEAEILAIVEGYYGNELMYSERLARVVRINPIFRARDVLVDDSLCFVLMPFGNDAKLQEVFADQIAPTIAAAGLKCMRADDIYDTQPIIESIWENIMRARLLVADLTGRNPNVFYELGIAHTVGKDVILLSQNIDDVPFDLRHLRIILYETSARGAAALAKQLGATFAALKSR